MTVGTGSAVSGCAGPEQPPNVIARHVATIAVPTNVSHEIIVTTYLLRRFDADVGVKVHAVAVLWAWWRQPLACSWVGNLGKIMRGLKILAIVAMSTVLAGCASGPAAVETTAPLVEASAVPVSEPTSRLGLACDDLLTSILVENLLDTTTVTTDLMVKPQSATPLAYAVSQLGGVSCLASGDVADQSFVSVVVLPEATTQWATYAAKNADVGSGAVSAYGDASQVACFNFGEFFTCSANILAGENWIDVYARGLNADPGVSNEAIAEQVAPLITDIVNTVTGAAAPGPRWVAPGSTGMLPTDCSVYSTEGEFQVAFSTAEKVLISGDSDGEGWGIDDAGWAIAGGDRCVWSPEGTGQTWPLYISALPGGEWAFDHSADLMSANDATQVVAQTPAGVDRATFGCHIYSGFCTLDTVIEGNWVQFSAEQDLVGTEDDVRALLIETAERAVARFPA
ncbi:hypothetical protein [Cryobacterium serini]|uniref:DUF3558 domain-containing protein n=1 Tax=Cryobacterium serini TaxID=1259201 RepID=A0A4R9BLC3_9MICO|nr:hypothetical protein [Cryobacterium serini]TFD86286.1 hypothetical protein E3T51_14310 [Cryobacterium serini]